MNKQYILGRRECLGSAYGFLDGKTLKDVIEGLQAYIADGWSEDAKFDVDFSEDGEIELLEYCLETDEEEQLRLGRERIDAEKQRKKKLDEYERLKKELGL